MKYSIDLRVKELIRRSLSRSEFRVSFVVALLREGLYEQALEQSLPLVGTKHSPWFLYAKAWKFLSLGSFREANRLLAAAFRHLSSPERQWEFSGFSFTEQGRPKLAPPFGCPLAYGDPKRDFFSDEHEFLRYSSAIFREDRFTLLGDIGRNIREYKVVFRAVAGCVERVLHHESDTVGAAVAAAELDDTLSAQGNSFLLLTLMSDSHLEMVADSLWRVCVDWNYSFSLCEIVSFFHFLLDDDETALFMADKGLHQHPESLICGNVRALVLNRTGRVHLADEQWRKTLDLNPSRSATYLVLGHQALCAGGLDPALRYFQEAVMLGDNSPEANRFLGAALDCL